MEKKLSDYLHLYLGCEVKIMGGCDEKLSRTGTFLGFVDYERLDCRIGFRAGPEGRCNTYLLKPILRPLSDMIEEEGYELEMFGHSLIIKRVYNERFHAERTIFLASKGFDLFGLIESGLAIDKTKLSQTK